MDKFFVPYAANSPAAVEIKGHRLLIVTSEPEDMANDLQLLGGDEIREVEINETDADQSGALADLAAEINCGVVLAPPGITPSIMIRSLEQELPWIH